MKIIAIEEHIATEPFLSQAHKLEVISSDQYEMSLMREAENSKDFRTALVDLEFRLERMDACGISSMLLSLDPPGVQPYLPNDAVPLARDFNDSLADIVRRYPDRFAGLGTVTPQDAVAAAHEVERIMGPLGLSGIMINSHTGGHYLDEPQFAPLLDAAEANHAPIYLHPRMPSMLAPYSCYGMQAALWGFQAEAGLHALRLILSGTFDRNPDLKIVLGHLGEGIPYWLRRIDNRHAFAERSLPLSSEDMPKLKLTPSEYFRRNFAITTSGMDDPEVLALALCAVGDENIIFATDYPYEDTQGAVNFLKDAPITAAQRENISHKTAQRIFALD